MTLGDSTENDGPVVFGEVLFDCFENGEAVLGGAPFNIAWHLRGFGLQPLFISRVGDDARGRRVLQAMTEWGLDTKGVQVDGEHPTGTVRVALKQGQPSFDILPDQAYDYIDRNLVRDALGARRHSLLYHGSLIARQAVSAAALDWIRRDRGIPIFVDINLRSPWWTPSLLPGYLQNSRWVKLNDAELRLIDDTGNSDVELAATALRGRYGLDLLILTLGADGALFLTKNTYLRGRPGTVSRLVDTVGAGDAFSAVVILGLLLNWRKEIILQRAIEFAASVCSIRGATIRDNGFYALHLNNWENDAGKF